MPARAHDSGVREQVALEAGNELDVSTPRPVCTELAAGLVAGSHERAPRRDGPAPQTKNSMSFACGVLSIGVLGQQFLAAAVLAAALALRNTYQLYLADSRRDWHLTRFQGGA